MQMQLTKILPNFSNFGLYFKLQISMASFKNQYKIKQLTYKDTYGTIESIIGTSEMTLSPPLCLPLCYNLLWHTFFRLSLYWFASSCFLCPESPLLPLWGSHPAPSCRTLHQCSIKRHPHPPGYSLLRTQLGEQPGSSPFLTVKLTKEKVSFGFSPGLESH